MFESRTFFDPAPIARPRHSLPLCSDIILVGAFSFPVVGVSINVHTAKVTYPCLYLATSRYDPRERSSTRLIEPCFVSLHCRFSNCRTTRANGSRFVAKLKAVMRSNVPLAFSRGLDDGMTKLFALSFTRSLCRTLPTFVEVIGSPKLRRQSVGKYARPRNSSKAEADKSSPGLGPDLVPNFLLGPWELQTAKEALRQSHASTPLAPSAPGPRMEVQVRVVSAVLAPAVP